MATDLTGIAAIIGATAGPLGVLVLWLNQRRKDRIDAAERAQARATQQTQLAAIAEEQKHITDVVNGSRSDTRKEIVALLKDTLANGGRARPETPAGEAEPVEQEPPKGEEGG